MTLQGTLTDLGIVDLVQFPHAGRKTGELIVVSADSHARLYYQQGHLVHAVMDDLQGAEVLVELFGLEEGEFEFRQDILTEETTIEGDLHLAVMQALKVRDERQLERDREAAAAREKMTETSQGQGQGQGQGDGMDQRLTTILDDFLSQNDYGRFAAVIDDEGQTHAEGPTKIDSDQLESLRACVATLARDYPREGLTRLFIEDTEGFVAAQRLSTGALVLVVAEGSVSMGVVSMGVSRLATALDDEVSP